VAARFSARGKKELTAAYAEKGVLPVSPPRITKGRPYPMSGGRDKTAQRGVKEEKLLSGEGGEIPK